MRARRPIPHGRCRTWHRLALLPLLALAVAACESAEEEVRPPEIAEIEREAGGDIEFEEAFPLTTDDIGDRLLVSGTVVGTPGAAGFFVRSEGNQVVFIQSADSVAAGQLVEVKGPVRAIDEAAFAGWERDFLGDVDPVWLVARLYYVVADTVAIL